MLHLWAFHSNSGVWKTNTEDPEDPENSEINEVPQNPLKLANPRAKKQF